MKVISKENLKFVNGYLVDKKGNAYNDHRVVDAVDTFVKTLKLISFVDENKDAIEMSGKVIEFKMPEPEKNGIKIECETPTLDEKAEQAMKCLEELSGLSSANRVNEFIEDHLQPLVDFVIEDEFVWTDEFATASKYCVDPLSIKPEDIEVFAKSFAQDVDLIEKVKITR